MNPCPQTIDDVDFTRTPKSSSGDSSLLFVLRAYCAGLLKACSIVNEIMKEELYYEVTYRPSTSRTLHFILQFTGGGLRHEYI